MGLLKAYIIAGATHLDAGSRDFASWAKWMIQEFGPACEPRLREIRQWSLLHSGRMTGPIRHMPNCWDVMGCGRDAEQPAGAKRSVCPVARETRLHGLHGGINAGRACWVVEGTFCCGSAPEAGPMKQTLCPSCRFYRAVREQHGPDHLISDDFLTHLME